MAGPDVVLLRGWMVGVELWAHQEEVPAGVARPHEIVLPGHPVAVSRLRQNASMREWAARLSPELDRPGYCRAAS